MKSEAEARERQSAQVPGFGRPLKSTSEARRVVRRRRGNRCLLFYKISARSADRHLVGRDGKPHHLRPEERNDIVTFGSVTGPQQLAN